jgi:hypothetical protein
MWTFGDVQLPTIPLVHKFIGSISIRTHLNTYKRINNVNISTQKSNGNVYRLGGTDSTCIFHHVPWRHRSVKRSFFFSNLKSLLWRTISYPSSKHKPANKTVTVDE